MKICILGWYGTETIGDRAILDGIIKICEAKEVGNTFFIGSLIPFFTEHTICYDKYCYSYDRKINIEVFCEKDIKLLKKYILNSDYVIMGGGPIMDISEILIIRKAFKFAKSKGIKTGLIGCGFGPFHNSFYRKIANEILNFSDVNIFRDEISTKRAISYNKNISATTISDPAVVSALCFKENNTTTSKEYIAINYRDTRFDIYKEKIVDIMDRLYNVVVQIANSFPKVVMIPMHTFFWGGDDRSYFAEMFNDRKIKNVNILYKPQSLYELYRSYSEAFGCVGMRYHAVVLQTILNGNNIIIDYTESKTGKIAGFMKEVSYTFYKDRYINIDDFSNYNMDYAKILNRNIRFDYTGNKKEIIEKYIGEMF